MQKSRTATRKVDPVSNVPSELWKGTSLELLKELHILTRDGKLNQDSRRKLKQVYHLTQLIEPVLVRALERAPDLRVCDLGAGKSYLGLILYDLILRDRGHGCLVAVEAREELVARVSEIARTSGFERFESVGSQIEDFNPGEGPVWICALHACDTATDDAILLGLKAKAWGMALVPCCQAEVARLLEVLDSDGGLEVLWNYPVHRREFGSHLTNVIRVLALQAAGYRVTVTELVGWEHSMKNELILAERISDGYGPARDKLQALLERVPVRNKLLRGLGF